jgi:ribose 5-phosphate isomerase B
MSREHNDANVLALGARLSAPAAATEIVETWLATAFLGGRHARRVEKLAGLDRAHGAQESVDAPAR